MILLNKIYALGEPTYEIFKERKSIIDYGLTNSKSIVKMFEILPIHLGPSPQTCHKIIKLTLIICMIENISNPIPERRIFRLLSEENANKYISLVVKQFDILKLNMKNNISYDQIRQIL